MKQGINFGHGPINPDDHAFAKTVKTDSGKTLRLQGLCDTRDEAESMLLQADNGRRTMKLRFKAGKYGIYTD